MTLTPVQSSHIAAIGYLEIDCILLVRYQDGSLRAWLGVTLAEQAALMAAPSKGKFLHALRGTSISLGGKEGAKIETGAQGAAGRGPLNSLDEDAGKCCIKALAKLGNDRLAPWECPQCGLTFAAAMVGPVRHWVIKPQVVIVR